MNEGKRGRPAKTHLHEDHHYRTSDESAAAGAPPVADESDQADTRDRVLLPPSMSAEHINESPIEEKIHQLVDSASLNGWHPIDTEIVMEMPPRNGMGVKLAETPDGDGVLAVWKKTRKFANTTHRWQESGKWVHVESGMDISFQPKYWKERF